MKIEGPYSLKPSECWSYYEGWSEREELEKRWSAFSDYLKVYQVKGEDVLMEVANIAWWCKAHLQMNRVIQLLCYLADHHPPDPVSYSFVWRSLMFIEGVLTLYRECRSHMKHENVKGYDGPARTLFEVKYDLSSASKRHRFAFYWMARLRLER